MDLVTNRIRDEGSQAAEGRFGHRLAALGVLALALGAMTLPPVVALMALLALIS